MTTRGRKPAKKPARPFAATFIGGAPSKPATVKIDPVANAEWNRIVGLLGERQTLSPLDLGNLTAYCSAFSTLARCRAELQTAPLTAENQKTGAIKAHPLLGVLSGAERSLAVFAYALGLAPTSRNRVAQIPEDREAVDELEELLG